MGLKSKVDLTARPTFFRRNQKEKIAEAVKQAPKRVVRQVGNLTFEMIVMMFKVIMMMVMMLKVIMMMVMMLKMIMMMVMMLKVIMMMVMHLLSWW